MKTTRQCPVCEKEFTRIHTKNKPPRYCSRACSNKAPDRMTQSVRSKISKGVRGPNHPGFKGGWKSRGGKGGKEYFFTWVPRSERPKNPTTNKRGYTHRSHYVWNKSHPDDPVLPGQMVHHINGDSLDDRPENLCKVQTQREHMKHHAKKIAAFRKRDGKGRFV